MIVIYTKSMIVPLSADKTTVALLISQSKVAFQGESIPF
jgi:hypothetical protein